MTYSYELAVADKMYSSWSLRGWLLFEAFGIPYRQHTARMYSQDFHDMLAHFAPARLVPAMKFDGNVVTDSLAMAETLAEQNPDRAMWPKDPKARALARSVTAEMHSGFGALREECTMNLRHTYPDFEASPKTLDDVERLNVLWALCREEFGQSGPWLFGDYSIADVFFAPAATRLVTYNLPMSEISKAYVDAHLNHNAFRRWRAMAFAQNFVQPGYDKDLEPAHWTGPIPLNAKAVEAGSSENSLCPYSSKAVTHFLEMDGRVFGFCNAFCRDKTVADPAAWDAFIKIYEN